MIAAVAMKVGTATSERSDSRDSLTFIYTLEGGAFGALEWDKEKKDASSSAATVTVTVSAELLTPSETRNSNVMSEFNNPSGAMNVG